MGRRHLVVLLLSLAALVPAAAANARLAADPFLPQEWWLADIGADITKAPGPGVPIVIIDSGTDPTHPEFVDRPNTTFLNGQTTVGHEEDHGTAVASVAAAPDNGVGIDGVYPNAALDIFDASPTSAGITDLSAAAGIDAAAQHCPAVINLSFGSTEPDPALQDAILTAVHNGCLVVAAAGNGGQMGSPPTYPASWPHVFTVGASDENDAVAPFTTTTPAMDVVAPGVDIVGAVPTTQNAVGYETGLSGTSFSAPIAAAAAAWVWTLRPTLTAYQLGQVLRLGAKDIAPPGFDNASGAGLLNIPGALAAAAPPNDPFEPNDDIADVKPGALFAAGEPALTTPARPSTRIAGSLDDAEDPRDVYRIWVPAGKTVRVSVTGSGGGAAARIWGPRTTSTGEGLAARRRDLRGPAMRGARKRGSAAYVEVLLTGRSASTHYVLSVTATKK